MSYAILYRNVSQRLKQLDERVSKFERGIEEDQLEWDKVRQDLVSVTRLASNLENLTDQDDTKLYKQYSRWSVTRGEECILLMKRFTEADGRYKQELAQSNREELLCTRSRFGELDNISRLSPNSNLGNTVLNIDEVRKREKYTYDYTRSQLGSYIDMGSRALEELSSQKSILLRARKKLASATRNLGLSYNLMHRIERRYSQNKLTIIAGITVTIIMMYFIVRTIG